MNKRILELFSSNVEADIELATNLLLIENRDLCIFPEDELDTLEHGRKKMYHYIIPSKLVKILDNKHTVNSHTFYYIIRKIIDREIYSGKLDEIQLNKEI